MQLFVLILCASLGWVLSDSESEDSSEGCESFIADLDKARTRVLRSCTDAVNCGRPAGLANGGVVYFRSNYNSVATYSCQPGFSFIGSSQYVVCGLQGWSDILGTCVPDICASPPSAVFTCSEGNTMCSEGFVTVGLGDTVCVEDGSQTFPATCVPSMCPFESSDLSGAFVLSPDTSMSRTVTLEFKYFEMEVYWDGVDVYVDGVFTELLDGNLGQFTRTYTTTGDVLLNFFQRDSIGRYQGLAFTYSTQY